jgi:hypothetical protein
MKNFNWWRWLKKNVCTLTTQNSAYSVLNQILNSLLVLNGHEPRVVYFFLRQSQNDIHCILLFSVRWRASDNDVVYYSPVTSEPGVPPGDPGDILGQYIKAFFNLDK